MKPGVPVTIEDIVHRGMVAGAPFPDLYDWTWGEILEYIDCKEEARRDTLRDEAAMSFRTVNLMMKMISADKGAKFNVMDAYEFLWTPIERLKARNEEARRKMEASAARGKAMEDAKARGLIP